MNWKSRKYNEREKENEMKKENQIKFQTVPNPLLNLNQIPKQFEVEEHVSIVSNSQSNDLNNMNNMNNYDNYYGEDMGFITGSGADYW